MFKIYGSAMCWDCQQCKKNFDHYGIEYEFIDINQSLRNLSVFLKMRDSDPVFDRCKQINDIGLPALVREDGSVFLNWEGYLEEKGMPVIIYELQGQACNIDGSGC